MKQEQLSKGSDLYGKIKDLTYATTAISKHINDDWSIKNVRFEFKVINSNGAYDEDTFTTNMTKVTPEMQIAIDEEFAFFARRMQYIYAKQIKKFQTEFDNL